MRLLDVEIKYIVFSAILQIALFLLVLPNLPENMSPLVQFLVFNVGIFITLFVFLKSFVLKNNLVTKGALGFLFLFIGSDILVPEYHVTIKGELLKGAILGAGSSDYILGMVFSLFSTGMLTYILVYIFSPIIFYTASALVLKNFVKEI